MQGVKIEAATTVDVPRGRERFIWDYDQCNYGRCDYKAGSRRSFMATIAFGMVMKYEGADRAATIATITISSFPSPASSTTTATSTRQGLCSNSIPDC